MEMSLVGILVILYSIKQLFKTGKSVSKTSIRLTEMCIIMCIFLDAGFVFKIGGFECEYNYYLCFISFLAILLFEHNRLVIDKRFIVLCIYLVSVVIIRYAFHTTFKSSSYNIFGGWEQAFFEGEIHTVHTEIRQFVLPLTRIIILGVIITSLSHSGGLGDVQFVCRKICVLSKYYLTLIFAEFVIINFLPIDFRGLLLSVVGNSSSTAIECRLVFGVKIPFGLSREPSSFALTCLIVFVNNLYLHIKTQKGFVITYIYFAMLVFSASLSSVLYAIGAVFLVYDTFKGNNKKVLAFVSPLVVLIGGAIIYSIYEIRFQQLMNGLVLFPGAFNALPFNSTIIRLYSIYNNLKCFLGYPLLGTGLNSIYSFSAIATIITNFGIIGSIMFFSIYFNDIKKICGIHYSPKKVIVFALICFLFTGHSGYILYYPELFYFFLLVYLIFYEKKAILSCQLMEHSLTYTAT